MPVRVHRVTYDAAPGVGVVVSPAAAATATAAVPSLSTATPNYLRGINAAGGEFGEGNLPGTYDVDYHYDAQASFTYLASRGHKVIRLPFRWERIQRTLGGPLDAAELTRLKAAVARIDTAGMRAVLDVHNYARYSISGVQHRIGGSIVNTGHLVDLWQRLSAEFRTNAAVYAYGLMNEPHDLPAASANYTPTLTLHTFDSSI